MAFDIFDSVFFALFQINAASEHTKFFGGLIYQVTYTMRHTQDVPIADKRTTADMYVVVS